SFEMRIMVRWPVEEGLVARVSGCRNILREPAPRESPELPRMVGMHVAHFIHRYPPAIGGAEAYFARLGEYLCVQGDTVTVWTTTAIELEAFWRRGFAEIENHKPLAPESFSRETESSETSAERLALVSEDSVSRLND